MEFQHFIAEQNSIFIIKIFKLNLLVFLIKNTIDKHKALS